MAPLLKTLQHLGNPRGTPAPTLSFPTSVLVHEPS